MFPSHAVLFTLTSPNTYLVIRRGPWGGACRNLSRTGRG
jgi:hypothetical protein